MLRASSISLIVATSLTLSVCLQPGQAAGDSQIIAQKSTAKTGVDAKKETASKSSKDKASDKKDSKDSKESKESKDKDSKDAKDSKSDSKGDGKEKADAKEEVEKEVVLTNVSN